MYVITGRLQIQMENLFQRKITGFQEAKYFLQRLILSEESLASHLSKTRRPGNTADLNPEKSNEDF